MKNIPRRPEKMEQYINAQHIIMESLQQAKLNWSLCWFFIAMIVLGRGLKKSIKFSKARSTRKPAKSPKLIWKELKWILYGRLGVKLFAN